MHAEIISIGDELTSGQRLDTNSQWISQRLGEIGIPVVYHTTVADDLEANLRVFRTAVERADVVIATGGLGPTADDLTRDVLAAVAGAELVLDEGALLHIEALFKRRGREMPPRNRVQAMFPAGSQVIHNPEGTAPGIRLDVPRAGRAPCRVFALPGVPAEMRQMWEQSLVGWLTELAGRRRVIRHRRIKCFGVGESDLEQMLPDMIRRGRDPLVGITVHEATITLRVTAAGDSEADCYARMEPTLETIRQCVGELAFGEEDDELEHAVLRALATRRKTLATIEWGTAGLAAQWLSAVGDDQSYIGGAVIRGETLAREMLEDLSDELDLRDRETLVRKLAIRMRRLARADMALAVGPFPTAASDASEVFWMALADGENVVARSAVYAGHSAILKPRAAKQALNFVRLHLARQAAT